MINNKLINKKIYALVIETPSLAFLSIQYASSLEEAFFLAKLEFSKENNLDLNLFMESKISFFLIKKLDEIIKIPEVKKSEKFQKKTRPVSEPDLRVGKEDFKNLKNKMMKQIIENKDKKMFEEVEKIFSSSEIKYIKNKL